MTFIWLFTWIGVLGLIYQHDVVEWHLHRVLTVLNKKRHVDQIIEIYNAICFSLLNAEIHDIGAHVHTLTKLFQLCIKPSPQRSLSIVYLLTRSLTLASVRAGRLLQPCACALSKLTSFFTWLNKRLSNCRVPFFFFGYSFLRISLVLPLRNWDPLRMSKCQLTHDGKV